MRDRRLLRNLDWVMLGLILALAGFGVLVIVSATHGRVTEGLEDVYLKQLLWLALGLIGLVLAVLIDYDLLAKHSYLLYLLVILLLLYVLGFGKVISGSRRWIGLGGFTFQPSEMAKLVTILVLARYFEKRTRSYKLLRLRDLVVPALIVTLPAFLIARQPDLGTALVFVFLLVTIVFVYGVHWKTVLIGVGVVAALLPVAWRYLHDYQRERVLTLLQPGSDPLGAGYHSLQSKIAIGSGGLWGKGLFAGTQTRLNFLPENHTDFIFSVVAEEMGFFGAMIVVALFTALLLRGISIAYNAKDVTGSLIAVGVVTLLASHVFLNIGMTTGLVPVVGLPLPLLSYGGSSATATLVGLGLLLNVGMRRYKTV